MVTLTNENGVLISVNPGDVVRMRSGNSYLMVEVPTGDWPTGVGVAPGSGTFQDVMLDRIHNVAPATPGSRQLANTINSIGLGSNMPERVTAAVEAVRAAAPAAPSTPRTAASATAAGTGNS